MLSTESLNKSFIHWFIAVICKNAKQGLTFIKSLCTFSQTTSKSIMYQRSLQHFLQCSTNIHRSTSICGSSRNNISFRIRHLYWCGRPRCVK